MIDDIDLNHSMAKAGEVDALNKVVGESDGFNQELSFFWLLLILGVVSFFATIAVYACVKFCHWKHEKHQSKRLENSRRTERRAGQPQLIIDLESYR